MNKITYEKVSEKLAYLEKLINGGPGSGNFGHFGRPGEVGGSMSAWGAEIALGKGISDRMREGGGFTVDNQGKFYDLGKTNGFAVGGFGTERSCSEAEWNNSRKKMKFLRDYIKENSSALQKEGNCLGGWKDGGKVYLDVSRVFKSEKEALREAMKTDQDAITDFKKSDFPRTKDLVKKYGLEKEYKQYKGIRKAERAKAEQEKKARDDDPLKDIPF